MAAQGRGLDVYISGSLITSMRFAGPSVTYHLSETPPGINQAAAVYRGFERSLWNIHEALNILEVEKLEIIKWKESYFSCALERWEGQYGRTKNGQKRRTTVKEEQVSNRQADH